MFVDRPRSEVSLQEQKDKDMQKKAEVSDGTKSSERRKEAKRKGVAACGSVQQEKIRIVKENYAKVCSDGLSSRPRSRGPVGEEVKRCVHGYIADHALSVERRPWSLTLVRSFLAPEERSGHRDVEAQTSVSNEPSQKERRRKENVGESLSLNPSVSSYHSRASQIPPLDASVSRRGRGFCQPTVIKIINRIRRACMRACRMERKERSRMHMRMRRKMELTVGVGRLERRRQAPGSADGGLERADLISSWKHTVGQTYSNRDHDQQMRIQIVQAWTRTKRRERRRR